MNSLEKIILPPIASLVVLYLERQNDHFIVSIHNDACLGLQLLVDDF